MKIHCIDNYFCCFCMLCNCFPSEELSIKSKKFLVDLVGWKFGEKTILQSSVISGLAKTCRQVPPSLAVKHYLVLIRNSFAWKKSFSGSTDHHNPYNIHWFPVKRKNTRTHLWLFLGNYIHQCIAKVIGWHSGNTWIYQVLFQLIIQLLIITS